MKTYVVRMEFDVDSIDFGDVVVEANSPEEAKQIVIDKYFNTNELDIDYYSSNTYDSTLRTEDSDEWLVIEREKQWIGYMKVNH